MPRPTTAQLAYGSCTVILSTLAMLLLSQTSSGLAITVIAVSALALGLLVAMTVPLPKKTPVATTASADEQDEHRVPAAPAAQERVPAPR
ncbi:hypothetical protein [Streptomyces bluensis]|uniref:Secreted protein n=1 Tax=Streptomyces bluensis TaxID=33897 RepID=A0ABW6UGC1_9ACTN